MVNSSKNFFLLMIKPKSDINHESFEGFDPKLKSDLYDVFNGHHEMFQEPTRFPLKREIQHEIQLQQECSLPNISMYRMSIMENAEIKRQIKYILDK